MSTHAKSGKSFWAVGTGIPISILVLLAVIVFMVGDANRTTTNRGKVPALLNDDPASRAAKLGMIQASDTDKAAAKVGHLVVSGRDLPGESLSSVWTSQAGTEVLEVYESGMTVLTEVPQFGSDALKYYEAVVADADRPSVYITTIGGVQALGVEPNTDQLGTNPGLVRFDYGGYSIVVSGVGMSVDYLTEVASKLHAIGAVEGSAG